MKERLGFVSNSSAASFCVYGVRTNWEFGMMIRQEAEKAGLRIAGYYDPLELEDGSYVVGAGNYNTDVDKWCTGDWQLYESKPPTSEEIMLFEKFIQEHFPRLKPAIYSRTWFDG